MMAFDATPPLEILGLRLFGVWSTSAVGFFVGLIGTTVRLARRS